MLALCTLMLLAFLDELSSRAWPRAWLLARSQAAARSLLAAVRAVVMLWFLVETVLGSLLIRTAMAPALRAKRTRTARSQLKTDQLHCTVMANQDIKLCA